MAHYRAYAVQFDGNFDGYESLSCDDDAEAIDEAQRFKMTALSSFGAANALLPEWNASRTGTAHGIVPDEYPTLVCVEFSEKSLIDASSGLGAVTLIVFLGLSWFLGKKLEQIVERY